MLGFFQLPFCFLSLYSTVVWEHTLYDFHSFIFVKVCFMAPNVVYLCKYFMQAWQECVCCYCWMKYSINTIRFSWFMVLFSSNRSLLIFCLLNVSITDRRVLKYAYRSGFAYISLMFYKFLPHILQCSLVLGTYTMNIVMSSSRIVSFIIM